jgi:hypothetical protein
MFTGRAFAKDEDDRLEAAKTAKQAEETAEPF